MSWLKITKIKTLLSTIFIFLLFLYSAHPIRNLKLNYYSWNQPIRMHEMSFKKLKATSKSLCKALGYYFIILLRKLDCFILQRLERELSFPFQENYFTFPKRFLNSSKAFERDNSPGGGRERTIHWGEFSLHHCYKQNFRRKQVTKFLVVSVLIN